MLTRCSICSPLVPRPVVPRRNKGPAPSYSSTEPTIISRAGHVHKVTSLPKPETRRNLKSLWASKGGRTLAAFTAPMHAALMAFPGPPRSAAYW